jgi:cytoskeletal protein RodZ
VSAIILIAVGAILKWAVTAHVSWISLETTGTVLFVLGLVALALALVYTFWWPGRSTVNDPYVDRRPPPTDGY